MRKNINPTLKDIVISRRRREIFFGPFLERFLYICIKIFRAEGAAKFFGKFIYIYINFASEILKISHF